MDEQAENLNYWRDKTKKAKAQRDECLETMKAALKESGCDGDLCAHNWHDAFRGIIRQYEPDWSAR